MVGGENPSWEEKSSWKEENPLWEEANPFGEGFCSLAAPPWLYLPLGAAGEFWNSPAWEFPTKPRDCSSSSSKNSPKIRGFLSLE